MGGFDEETAAEYADHIIQAGRMQLNPSSSLGNGADVVDCFSVGYMVLAKKHSNEDIDTSQLWFHPCRSSIPVKITAIEYELVDAEIESNEHTMYFALDKNGKSISAEEAAANQCPGNRDNLDAYGPEAK